MQSGASFASAAQETGVVYSTSSLPLFAGDPGIPDAFQPYFSSTSSADALFPEDPVLKIVKTLSVGAMYQDILEDDYSYSLIRLISHQKQKDIPNTPAFGGWRICKMNAKTNLILPFFFLILFFVCSAGSAHADSWSTKTAMPTARSGVSAATMSGIVYAIGGGTGITALATNEAYDPGTNTWSTRAAMPTARGYLAVTAAGTVILAIGGYTNTGIYHDTNEAYNRVTNTWSTRVAMPTARSGLAAVTVGGIVYAIGGSNSSIYIAANAAYNPGTNTWSTR